MLATSVVAELGTWLKSAYRQTGRGKKSLANVNLNTLRRAIFHQIQIADGYLIDPTGVTFDHYDEMYSPHEGGREFYNDAVFERFSNTFWSVIRDLKEIERRADSVAELFFAPFLLLCPDIYGFSNVTNSPVYFNPNWLVGRGKPMLGTTQLGCQIKIGNRRADFALRIDDEHGSHVLLIEIDSIEYHMNPRSMYEDRLRDRQHRAMGFETTRFMAKEIFESPYRCFCDILDIYQAIGAERDRMKLPRHS